MDRQQRGTAFAELRPICVCLSSVWTGAEVNSKKVWEALEELEKVLERHQKAGNMLGSGIADYIFMPLGYLWRQQRELSDRVKSGLVGCTGLLIETGWRTELTEKVVKELCVLLTGFVRAENAEMRDMPEDIRIKGIEALERLFWSEQRRREEAVGVGKKGEADGGRERVSEVLEYSATEQVCGCDVCGIVWDSAGEGVSEAFFARDYVVCLQTSGKGAAEEQPGGGAVNGVKGATEGTQEGVSGDQRRDQSEKAGVEEDVRKIGSFSALQSPVEAKEMPVKALGAAEGVLDGSVAVLSSEWLLNTREHMYMVCTVLMKLKTHFNQRVRQQVLEFSFRVAGSCFKTLNNCVKQSLLTILFLAGDMEAAVQDVSVSRFFELAVCQSHEPEFWNLIDLLLKEHLDTWPEVCLLPDEDAKRRHLVAVMHIVSLLLKERLEISFISDFLIHGISDSLCFAANTKVSRNTDLIQPVSHLYAQDPFDNDGLSGQTFPVFHFVNIESNLTFLALEKIFTLFGKYSSVEFLNYLLYKIKASLCESRANVLKWVFLCSLRDVMEHYDSYIQYNDNQDLKVNMEDICMDIYTDSSNYISDFSSSLYDDPIDCNISQSKVIRICLDLEIVSLVAKKLGKGFRTEFVDCLYPIVYLLGSPYENITKHARICLNNLAMYCEYNSVQDLLIGNVDYLINAINLKLNTFDVMPTGPSILVILLRLIGSSIVPYLEDIVDSVFVVLDNYHGYSKLVSVFFSFLNEVIQVNSNSIKPSISNVVKEDDIHNTGPCLEVIHIVDKIHSLYHKNTVDGIEAVSKSSSHSLEKLSNNINKVTLKIIQKISNKSQVFLNHQSSNIRNGLLKMLSTSIPFLSLDEKSFLPFVNDIWPLVIAQLNLDEMTSVILSALDVIALLCVYAKDFMTSRLSKHGIKNLCDLLSTSLQRSNYVLTDKFSRSIKIQNKIFLALNAAVENVKLPDKTIDKMIESVIFFFRKSDRTLEAETLMKTLEKIYSDKLWLSMLPFLDFKDVKPLSEDGLIFSDVVL
ncbi:uncharacterized protein T551_02536 [Pneumocystis jirovecii RU7]|uniref:Uncharacterized protein n=1 Tax=Pneumocystis jirovecii (strain RU7) TaxID=1408657 RepID=A0A0W4ZJX4_PNEJ7|nr:uncharacterized protein T551_02536 [Pneumocystis jirovecii RU7]KTW28686.1 hypothetical protein T551_02536 [Pneumocystis jirovecii RU7]